MRIISSNRISVDARVKIEDDLHSTNMFKEDLVNTFSRYGKGFDRVNCELLNLDSDFMNHLEEVLPGRGYSRSFKEIVFGFAEAILSDVLRFGYSAFEIVESEDINEFKQISLERIIGDEVEIRGNYVIQRIDSNHVIKKEIPLNKCFYIPMLPKYGNKKSYLEFVKMMNKSDKLHPAMNFLNANIAGMKGYDYQAHVKLHTLESWKLYRQFHWPGRESKSKYFSGYFYIRKHLEFKLTQIHFRDHVLSYVKEIVEVLSQHFGEKNELIISGLIESSIVEEMLEKWELGDATADEITGVLF